MRCCLRRSALSQARKRCILCKNRAGYTRAHAGRIFMLSRSSTGAIALAAFAALIMVTVDSARAFDDALYPDLKGQWIRARPPAGVRGQGPFDPDKSWGKGQGAPLTPEYEKIFEASLADQAEGGQGLWAPAKCLPVGMPGMMTLFR